MKFRSSKTIRREFLESRNEQSDSAFIEGCDLPREFTDSALKVRTAIANLANVDPRYVRAEDTFDHDLAHFDFWGSLDSIAVVLELEKCLGIRIPDEEAAEIPNPERRPGITVAEFMHDVLCVVQKRDQ